MPPKAYWNDPDHDRFLDEGEDDESECRSCGEPFLASRPGEKHCSRTCLNTSKVGETVVTR